MAFVALMTKAFSQDEFLTMYYKQTNLHYLVEVPLEGEEVVAVEGMTPVSPVPPWWVLDVAWRRPSASWP